MKASWILVFLFIKTANADLMYVDSTFDADAQNTTDTEVGVKVRNGTKHKFFRNMDMESTPGGVGSRRVFGGSAIELAEFPAVCALLDRYYVVRCSAIVLTNYWVLTAAHCVAPKLAYVKYNTRRPASNEGNVSAIQYLYRHPKYKVYQSDDGNGLDVTTLHHDVGLVRVKDEIQLSVPIAVFSNLRRNNPLDLFNTNIKVLGFGRTERSLLGEELFSADLRLVRCERSDWLYCVCGLAPAAAPRGVCSGDSGGPVLYGGMPVGVTSMGPVECARGGETPPVGATSVFTSLYQYTDVINATIQDMEAELRMRRISKASSFTPLRMLFAIIFVVLDRIY